LPEDGAHVALRGVEIRAAGFAREALHHAYAVLVSRDATRRHPRRVLGVAARPVVPEVKMRLSAICAASIVSGKLCVLELFCPSLNKISARLSPSTAASFAVTA